MHEIISRHFKVRPEFVVKLVVFGVALNGLIILWGSLVNQLILRGRGQLGDVTIGLPLIIGLTLLYLSSLLARRKRAAWTVTILVYAFIFGLNILAMAAFNGRHFHFTMLNLLRNFLVPAIVLGGLVLRRNEFRVKSDIRSFTLSLRFIVLILLVTLAYGVIGFQLMDQHDFHQEIGWGEAVQRTIDQFGLTTDHDLVPHTRRARLFLDSLSIISIGAVSYGVISLFQPLRARFSDQTPNRELIGTLLRDYPASSEDFFKLWPHDKTYFFNSSRTASLAFHVTSGVVLVVGDPAGNPHDFGQLLHEFDELCLVNDWLPAIMHSEPQHNELYEAHGYSLQKIGEEAILDLHHFQTTVVGDKYFRQIRNRFTKLGYTAELLQPPHNDAVLARLRLVSNDWLARPGRTERRLLMGYFSVAYVQQCPVMVVRDAASTIQAFLNQIPTFDTAEANFDMLRSSNDTPGNINDFLLMNFIDELTHQGFERLNLGLSPLAGLSEKDKDNSVIDNAMRFVYANGDRFYSFSGLHRFKSKYEPEWHERYTAYRGGLRGFTRTANALNRAMKLPKHLPHDR